MPGFNVNTIGGNTTLTPATAEYYYSYTWQILQLFNVLPGEVQTDDSPLIHAKDMTLPTFTVNKETVMGASIDYKYAKGISCEDIKITWYDTYGLLSLIRAWRRRVWTPESGLGQSNAYKRRSILVNYLPDTESINAHGVVEYTLIGSWPSVIRYGDLTYANSDAKLVEVTLTYDWFDEVVNTSNR